MSSYTQSSGSTRKNLDCKRCLSIDTVKRGRIQSRDSILKPRLGGNADAKTYGGLAGNCRVGGWFGGCATKGSAIRTGFFGGTKEDSQPGEFSGIPHGAGSTIFTRRPARGLCGQRAFEG